MDEDYGFYKYRILTVDQSACLTVGPNGELQSKSINEALESSTYFSLIPAGGSVPIKYGYFIYSFFAQKFLWINILQNYVMACAPTASAAFCIYSVGNSQYQIYDRNSSVAWQIPGAGAPLMAGDPSTATSFSISMVATTVGE